jgi:hypothetical protein
LSDVDVQFPPIMKPSARAERHIDDTFVPVQRYARFINTAEAVPDYDL